jgi:hypothetical protein
MFKATEKTVEMVKEYFKERNIDKPLRIALQAGG